MTDKRYRRSIVWLRRDLRLRDNVALDAAARASDVIVVAFNLDPQLLTRDRVGAPIVKTFFRSRVARR
ncbi:MAG TPA: deoxyribodipyrimidine photo-lyase [Candidatus Lustribacter sp.]